MANNFEGTVSNETVKELITQEKKADKVAICGFASNWQDCPWDDLSFEIWGLNELYNYFKTIPNGRGRAERWFEIHNRTSPTKSKPEHIAWLKQCPVPVYMWEHYDDIPMSIPYPLDKVLAFVESKGLKLDFPDGTTRSNRYITNSISTMFLLAWMEGFKEIHIYGVDLAQNEEYAYQRPNLEYYIGAAQMDGVKVVMPPTCDLLKAASLYGFESDGALAIKLKFRVKELEKQMNQHKQVLANAQNAVQTETMTLNQMMGHISELKFVIKNLKI